MSTAPADAEQPSGEGREIREGVKAGDPEWLKVPQIACQDGEAMGQSRAGDRQVGPARRLPDASRLVEHLAYGGSHLVINRQDAIAIQMLNSCPPFSQLPAFGRSALTLSLCDARRNLGCGDDGKEESARSRIHPGEEGGWRDGLSGRT